MPSDARGAEIVDLRRSELDERRDEHHVRLVIGDVGLQRRIVGRRSLEPPEDSFDGPPRPSGVAADRVRRFRKETRRPLARPVAQLRRVVEQPMLVAQVLEAMAQSGDNPRPLVGRAFRRDTDGDTLRKLPDEPVDQRASFVGLALNGKVDDMAASRELAQHGVEIAEVGETPHRKTESSSSPEDSRRHAVARQPQQPHGSRVRPSHHSACRLARANSRLRCPLHDGLVPVRPHRRRWRRGYRAPDPWQLLRGLTSCACGFGICLRSSRFASREADCPCRNTFTSSAIGDARDHAVPCADRLARRRRDRLRARHARAPRRGSACTRHQGHAGAGTYPTKCAVCSRTSSGCRSTSISCASCSSSACATRRKPPFSGNR